MIVLRPLLICVTVGKKELEDSGITGRQPAASSAPPWVPAVECILAVEVALKRGRGKSRTIVKRQH